MLFRCEPAVPFALRLRDTDGFPTTAHFVATDDQGRVYSARWRRPVPDFFFQDQVYRADGETLHLPPGAGGRNGLVPLPAPSAQKRGQSPAAAGCPAAIIRP